MPADNIPSLEHKSTSQLLTMDGRTPKQMTNFTDGSIFSFASSRDGKQLFLARGAINSDVVLINNVK
ncbi:MAG: hypothetical protein WBQ10_04565 [Terriglobales bacterium]